jgi:preprotein translocase subunit YajC
MMSVAYAEQKTTSTSSVQQQPPGLGDMLLPLGLMFLVFYFLLIRPNQKKAKHREEFIKNIKKGDEVITTGGILGRVVGVTDLYLTLDISENVKIKILKSHVSLSVKDIQQEKKETEKK